MAASVLVLGAGFGGLEVAARLSEQLGADAAVTLIDSGDSFVFGFSKLDVMFGRQTPEAIRMPYSQYTRPGVTFVNEHIEAIDPVERSVTTNQGTYSADILVVALGAGYDTAATPGLETLGNEFYSVPGAIEVRSRLAEFDGGDIVIGVCGGGYKCPPAPNECALLLHEYLEARGIRDRSSITVVVPMPTPLPPAPELSSALLERYAERGITFIPSNRVMALEPTDTGTVAILSDDTRLAADLFLGVPIHRAPQVVIDAGLTEDGWIPVERGTAKTRFPGVYAVGDVTSVGTPKAGVFSEGAARVVADQLIDPDTPGYDGTGACYVELGNGEVGGVLVDFFREAGPRGYFTEPADVPAGVKDEFGASRRQRWFGA